MASSSTSSVPKSFKYDVFLSFRGEDTRTNFIDHLYYALKQKSINTYKDDEAIKKGKLISDELIGSIQDSKFYLIVFSKNYASSRWCLDELVKIMECQKTSEHTAYPVFYDVEPTEVRNQIGAVGEAFAKHENDEAAGKWKEALKEAADLAGWELKKTANGHEVKFIQKIIEDISLELRSINFSFDDNLVGMDTRVEDVISYLKTDIDDVRMIGIKGMGGGGKTTLARAVFDYISLQFEGRSFVENVREVSKASLSGMTSLQSKVLIDVLEDRDICVSDVHNGKHMMKSRMCSRKVLVVLDDVDDKEQLEALAGAPNWFKSGSRIIITTRDEQVLVAHRVNWILDANLLSTREAICLLSKYAFGREIPIPGYEELSAQVVCYAAGLPLTIRVLGSFLCGKNESEWIDALERLKTIPLKETLQKLELSYNGLEEDYKEIFLTLACILKGWSKDLAIEALDSCGFHARTALKVLEQKSLISTFSYGFKTMLGMHDHVEEMGRNIVRRSHPHTPKKHSRLWIDEEVEDILANKLGTKGTRYICINLEKVKLEIVMKGLRKMKELRFLNVSTGNRVGERNYDNVSLYLPNALQYLNWSKYPLGSLPKTFQGNNLVALKMKGSNIEQLWEEGERKVLNKLKILDLSHSKLKTVDLHSALNIEQLYFENCNALVELHLPDRCLKLTHLLCTGSKLMTLDIVPALNLKTLNLDNNKVLVRLDIGPAPNLENLHLYKCYNLEELQMGGRYQKIITLNISHSKLKTLDLRLIPNLKNLELKDCKNLVQLQDPTGCLEKLVYLVLSGCLRFKSFVFDIRNGASSKSDESLEVGPLTELHLIAKSLKICPLHPGNTLPKFQFECYYEDEYPSLTRNLETLISVGLCACTSLEAFSGSICGLRRLRKLKLEGYPEAPKDLGSLDCLEELSLSTASMKHLPDSISMLKHLNILKLKCCWRLEKLPEDLGRLECLKRLSLSSAKIKHLPNSICLLKHLILLDIRNCFLLEKLPEDLGQLISLEELHLWFTKIKHLPGSICMLKHLKILDLFRCSLLETLPEDLGRLECLSRLTLSYSNIRHIPDTICMLKNLKDLKLAHCSLLEKLPEDLDRLECLEWLKLSGCKSLQDIPISICKMKHLEKLDVAGTSISHLPHNISLLKGLRIKGSRGLLESCGFTFEIQTDQYEDTCFVRGEEYMSDLVSHLGTTQSHTSELSLSSIQTDHYKDTCSRVSNKP